MARMSRRGCVVTWVASLSALCAGSARGQDEGPLNLPPLNGFQPMVIFGLTDEQYQTDFSVDSFSAHASSTPGGNGVPSNTLPVGQPQKFFVGVLDSGAQSSIITQDTSDQANLASADRLGDQQQEIIGANGSEEADVTDALGVYMSGFDGAQVNGSGTLGLAGGATLNGLWNDSVLTAANDSALPNIMGSPTIGLYQVSIKSSQPQHVTVGGTTYRSPTVSFAARNTAISNTYGKVGLTTTNTVGGDPAFEPSLENFDNTGDNPSVPTIWESLFANVKVNHTGGSETDSFLFDTGAQVSVLSSTTAADIGIFTTGAHPTKADFTTEVTGVGGANETVSGYYISGMTLTTTSGPIVFTRVPVIVLDLPDPRNPNQTVPGVLGTNLFTARDLTINVATGNSFLAISPEWSWSAINGGSWGNSNNWGMALPNGMDSQANFFTPDGATGPQTVTVDSSGVYGGEHRV